jgi:hypothetical protein
MRFALCAHRAPTHPPPRRRPVAPCAPKGSARLVSASLFALRPRPCSPTPHVFSLPLPLPSRCADCVVPLPLTPGVAVGAVTCAPCDAGFYSEGYAVNCTACDPGYYSGNAADACTDCPAGSYNDLSGQGVCSACSGESYSGAKSTSCELCVKRSTRVIFCWGV